MVALKGRDIEAFLARPDPGKPIVLLYGPDTGLVRERAEALLKSAVDDPGDPFSTVQLDGDGISSEPSRLVDEAMTVPMFGGRRAIRVRAGTRNLAAGVETLAGMDVRDCRIVIEAGELRPDAPLRKACERAKNAVAIPCYPDTARDLERLIETELGGAGLKISSEVRAELAALLGGDRMASRNELRKLALYAHGDGVVTLDAVAAVVTDATELKSDPVIDAAFLGRPAVVESEFTKSAAAGIHPTVVLSMAMRHAAQLHKAAMAYEEGGSVESAVESAFPRLHFSRKAAVEGALRGASAARLATVIEQLGQAAFDARKDADLAEAIARRALLSIAVNARRRA